MKKIIIIFLMVMILQPLFSHEISFLYMAQSGYQPQDILDRAQEFYRKTGISVKISFPEYENRYKKIVQSFSGNTTGYDVILVDLIWMRDFIEKGYLEHIPAKLERTVKKEIIPEIYNAFEYENKLWAMPFHADFQLLYVNKKLLNKAGYVNPPETLEEMESMAEKVKDLGLLKYPLFDSWNRQEVLVCEYTWLTGSFGGKLIDENGKINLLTGPSKKALVFMVSLLRKGLMNPLSLKSDEIFSSEVFLSGDCLFTTNWTFLAELARKSILPIKNSWFPALIPVSKTILRRTEQRTASISGYEGLGVPVSSHDKKDAWSFIEFLSSPDFQKKHLDYMSVWKNVWREKNTLKNDPYIALKEKQIKGVFNRPVIADYKTVSSLIQKWIYKALLFEVTPEYALTHAQKEIDDVQ